jgi:tripeptidyl-peptidase-1
MGRLWIRNLVLVFILSCLLYLSSVLVSAKLMESGDSSYVQVGQIDSSKMNGFSRVGTVDNLENRTHEIEFRIRQNNIDKVKKFVDDTSDPRSSNYGKHMTKAELDELTGNPEGKNLLHEFLSSIGATIIKEGNSGITARAPLSVWNEALKADFAVYKRNGGEASDSDSENRAAAEMDREGIVRTPSYSLPNSLAKEVDSVFNTVQFPAPIHRGPRRVGPMKKG